MGFDCTLHAVDERQISSEFVNAVLSGKPPSSGAEGDVGIAVDLWEALVKSLAEDPPEIAASTLCQMAIVFASKKHPYHYERGFAVCLWPEQTEVPAAELPRELSDSPESLFNRLFQRHPALPGHFPTAFDGNWSTGTFIPAKKVPKALKWVEKQVRQAPEGERDLFRGLILVLKHCAKHELAYWEGTDLPVPMATMSIEGNETRRAERCFTWPDYGYIPLAQRDSLIVCQHRLGAGNKQARTALADFSTWPPTLDWIPEYAITCAFSCSGKLVTVAADPGSYFYDVRLRSHASSKGAVERLSAIETVAVGEHGYEWSGFFGGQVVSMLSFKKDQTANRHPLFWKGQRLEPEHSLQPPNDNHSDHWGGENIKFAVATVDSGACVLIWDVWGYENIEGELQKTFSVAPGPMWSWGRETVPAGSDGFFYLTNSSLFEAQRRKAPIQHLSKLTNVMAIRSGPEKSLILKQGDNKAGDWGKLYWPETGQIMLLRPDILPDIAPRELRDLRWLAGSNRLLLFADKEVWFVPWSELQTLPRQSCKRFA